MLSRKRNTGDQSYKVIQSHIGIDGSAPYVPCALRALYG
ncbi:hypothetical protein HMPREF9248_0879 [Fannyhessea vaginae PB189-T1-4]|uniref:Uncharacterized protein n=1 Tax=Fannyhessea vaginae PB189-T1-4 TaxID=866774 RepID=A0ABN0B0E6_9ACTN|nr:hypothetical protein HMPREF9248_0879 [Fannyhessea vaginae PB189-T1-4]